MTADDARRLRASLDARIINESPGSDTYPLRRRLAYQRILRRLGAHPDGGWVLKGGYLLEARLLTRSRATKDLDLAMREVDDGAEVASLLREALTRDPDNDHFNFTVAAPTELAMDGRDNRGWRVSVDALLDGRSFARLRIDVVERLDELAGAVELVTVPTPVSAAGLADARISAVDIAQHAAEKFHALCRVFADGRVNTRVKDLVDIVLMAEADLLPHPALPARIRSVFRFRDDGEPPADLPDPPASWRRDYELLAAKTEVERRDLDTAFALASSLFRINQLPS